MYMGLDIGTSAIKAVLCDDRQSVVARADVPLVISRPHPLWSEQDPEDWWTALLDVLGQLRNQNAPALAAVKSIGIAGQMHGAVLLDGEGHVLRPAILWNDGRSDIECGELEKAEPRLRELAGNIAMPGFTAPKLKWVAKHEPVVFSKIAKVLLPKDYIRLRLTGDYVSEMSDAAGTLWLDVGRRKWSPELLAATDLGEHQMPRLVEGTEASGLLQSDIADACGLPRNVIVCGGGGDNAAGAIGIGAVKPGQAFLSLGTSGVLFLCNEKYSPNPARTVHAFCHCLPETWHQMSVILSAASCLSWVAKLTGAEDEAALLDEIAAEGDIENRLLFLPYLSGERTPHNNPRAQGVFFGLTHDSNRAQLGRAVLEGVAFAFADGMDALLATGEEIHHISVIGGGERSALWGQILADILQRDLTYHEGGDVGPAYGAARLARLAVTGEDISIVCIAPKVKNVIQPDIEKADKYTAKLERYRQLYAALKQEFAA